MTQPQRIINLDKGATNLKLVGLAAWWDGKGEEHEWLEVHRALLTAVADDSTAK